MIKYIYHITMFCGIMLFSGCTNQENSGLGFFELKESTVQIRQLQSRKYETTKDDAILKASISSLQDLGFEINEVNNELGTLVATKNRDAQEVGQNFKAYALTFLAIIGGNNMGASHMQDRDFTQKIKASIVVSPYKNQTTVRIVFQRAVYSPNGSIRKLESLTDVPIYEAFFAGLSKSIFLEGHNI